MYAGQGLSVWRYSRAGVLGSVCVVTLISQAVTVTTGMWREGKATRILLWAFCVVTWLRYSVGLAYCDVPSPSKSFEAAAGVCVREGGVALSLDDAAQIAWKYAPVLYFHPDEKVRAMQLVSIENGSR